MAGKRLELYSHRKARKKGKIDGKDWLWKFWPFSKNYDSGLQSDPPVDQEPPSRYEYELMSNAINNLEIISGQWAQSDLKLKESCKNALDKHRNAKDALEKENPEAKASITKYETAKKRYLELPIPHLSGIKKWLLLLIVGASEVYFNKLVFSVFGLSSAETWIMTIGLMAVILFIPHFVGIKLRVKNKSKDVLIGIIVGCIAVIAIMVVIATLRVKFFEANNVVEMLKIKWDTDSIGIAFFVVNIVIAIGVILIGYESGHEDISEYKKRTKALEEAGKELKKEGGEATVAQKKLQEAEMELNKAHVSRTKKFQEIQHQANSEVKGWKSLVEVYRTANMEARRDKRQPKSFGKDVSANIKLPQTLEKLDLCEKCVAKE